MVIWANVLKATASESTALAMPPSVMLLQLLHLGFIGLQQSGNHAQLKTACCYICCLPQTVQPLAVT